VQRVTTAGRDRLAFLRVGDDCVGVTLAPGETCDVVYRYAPEALGEHVATARIVSSIAGAEDASTVALSGAAAAASTGSPGPAGPAGPTGATRSTIAVRGPRGTRLTVLRNSS